MIELLGAAWEAVTIGELLGAAKANPGKLTFGSGNGSARGAAELAAVVLRRPVLEHAHERGHAVGDRARQGDDGGNMVQNIHPSVLAVTGLQIGYLMGGSILVETVFAWPGTGFLLNTAIFQRDIPLLQGTILVLALFFVLLNLLVDVAQAAIDPRIKRG